MTSGVYIRTKKYRKNLGKAMSKVLTGRKLSKEHCQNMSKALKGKKRNPFSEEWKQNMSKSHIGKKFSKEHCQNISKANKGRKFSEEWIRNLSKDSIEKWKNPKYREKQLNAIFKGLQLKPNKPEKLIINLIRKNKLPFNYVGDGQVIIGGFCPDFLSKNPKQIIELFGDYWHNRKDWKKRDEKRIKTFSRYGYKTLVIWEHELKNLSQVLNKINNFLENG